jgi:ketosteroid isomerase-like protein
MEIFKQLSAGFLITFICCNCNSQKVKETETPVDYSAKIKLLEADKAFSDMCEKQGMKDACIAWMDDENGVLLRPHHLPVAGAHAIDYLIQLNDTGYVLKWQPHNAEVAQAGDMGYTYGIYSIIPSVADTQLLGTYVNVWKKQKDGSWKFVVNSWNEGIGDQQY